MRNIWNWVKDDAGPITATIAILGGFAAIIQFSVVRPMQQGFDAVGQRFDAQDKRIEDLVEDVSGLRKLSDRVTPQRNTHRRPHRAVADRRRTLALNLRVGHVEM